ncbi:MAG: ammonia-forming cytochrome c nitrite reductase subunit c552 [Verrucomicrobia bacterium]|nr:ammonia-forming cytochrome c nitrite reductase subunit c552 [Verrucomicrobiota bacterium]
MGLLLLVALAACGRKAGPSRPAGGGGTGLPVLAKSAECTACHRDLDKSWRTSMHAMAHRKVGKVEDSWAFRAKPLQLGKVRWQFSGSESSPRIDWRDDGSSVPPISLAPPMAIGHRPLIQYVLDFGNGRYQVPDASWDPVKQEWFSMFGTDQRQPHEWGHWTQRGMNWNSQCAYCHFSQFRKNHQLDTDAYATTWLEEGVGCTQCHGPSRPQRAATECIIDSKKKFTPQQWMHSCATCHSRREELDEEFLIGDNFYDHYSLALPSQPGLYHSDGQQIDEDYNFTSLLLSRMGHRGISCIDCHDSHAATPKGGKPAVDTNVLCMQCHGGGARGAIVIEQWAHSFHKPGTAGSRCVECHMPKTTYMARDPRSDHRFPSPDPLLTQELGVPNTCNNCHADKGLDWQIEWTNKWYGPTKKPLARERTRVLAAAFAGKPEAMEKLLAAFDVEEIAAWQATLLRLMEPWASDARVTQRAERAAVHADPLVRTAAAFLLARVPANGTHWEPLSHDPVRAVRLEAGWAALERLPANHPLWPELDRVARHQADQPAGRMRLARMASVRGDAAATEAHLRKAAEWDQGSMAPRRDLAVYLAGAGRTREALPVLAEAAKLAPKDPELPYLSALALAELGDQAGTEAKLREAIRLAPRFSRAYYNLGLLLSGQGHDEAAIIALRNASNLGPNDPEPPYALATIYLRLDQTGAAATAAREALQRNPAHQAAATLLQSIRH